MRKYELTDECRDGLYRIRALRDICAPRDVLNRSIQAGSLGGWIASEESLSQDGDCWVAYNAIVRDNARVRDDAWVVDHAVLRDNAVARDLSLVSGNAEIKYNAQAEEECVICGNAIITGNARIAGDVTISGDVCIADDTLIYSCRQYITVGPIGSGDQMFTLYNVNGALHINYKGASMAETEFVKIMIDEYNNKEFSAMLNFAHAILD